MAIRYGNPDPEISFDNFVYFMLRVEVMAGMGVFGSSSCMQNSKQNWAPWYRETPEYTRSDLSAFVARAGVETPWYGTCCAFGPPIQSLASSVKSLRSWAWETFPLAETAGATGSQNRQYKDDVDDGFT